ncbi:pentapeptide repeat-containing protein [Rothia sp. P13129]|uniref:pentapeptide repeat-containing protein n=1 Tax=Rothia sp. P13129 TaxID=3402664 RepID=UPI003AD33E19
MLEKVRKTIKEKYENFKGKIKTFKEDIILWIKKSFSKIKLSYIFYALPSLISGILIGEIWLFSSRGGENQTSRYDGQFWFSDIRVVCLGVIGFALQLFFISQKEKLNYIGKIICYIVPLFAFIISIGVWVLIWATYGGDEQWRDVRSEIITGFTGLVAAVGVLATVSVNYKNHEENRISQAENVEKQLEEQRKLREQQYVTEQERRDGETIKDLNERLHEILKNRHDRDDDVRASSYFQLAGLYKDWGLLGENSAIIEAQRKVQQKNILKLIFGTAPHENAETKKYVQKNSAQFQSSFLPKKVKEHVKRSFLEITTLNSVIADIFPNIYDKDKESFEPFDLQYANLSGLTFSEVFFPQRSNLSNAHLTGAILQQTNFEGVSLSNVNLKGANLESANLCGANLDRAIFKDANLKDADLQGAHLWYAVFHNAILRGAIFEEASLQYTDFECAKLQDANLYKAIALTSQQLAQADGIESIEIRRDLAGLGHGEEDQDLKNLIQEALEIQKQKKNI